MTIDPKRLPTLRVLQSYGDAVVAAKMGINHWDARKRNVLPLFGIYFLPPVKAFQTAHKIPATGVIGPATWTALLPHLNATARALLQPVPPPPTLVYPIDKNWHSAVPSYIHPTGGIPGNYALDWMCAPGGLVLAPEAGTITRTSGNNPTTGLHGSNRDVFGWSIYLKSKTGFYYGTHMGHLAVRTGYSLKAGDVIGQVGDWPYDRGRSHLHLGFTSSTRLSTVSRRKILAVAAAPRVEATGL